MKKLFLISFLFIIASAAKQSQGQTNIYHPFPDSNAVWTWEFCVSNPNPACGSYPNFLNGDTVVNSIAYHKLFGYSPSPTIVGGIRNDTVSKKTYFICFNSSSPPNCSSHLSEKILYDFSAGIGDTVFYGTCGISYIVTSIDSIQLLDGTYRKRFKCNNCFGGEVIEGIGNNGNLICGTQDGMAYLSLLCFEQDSTTLYTQSPSMYNPAYPNSCITLVGMQEQNATFSLTISPNPFSTQTTLQTDNLLHNATLTVYNSYGQQVKQFVIRNSSSFVIRRDNLPSGLYFIRLTQDDKTFATDKLVITD